MRYSITPKPTTPKNPNEHCMIIGVGLNQALSNTAKILDTKTNGYIKKLIKNGDFSGKSGETLMLFNIPKLTAERILLVGLGDLKKLTPHDFPGIIQNAIKAVRSSGCKQADCYLLECAPKETSDSWRVRQAVIAASEAGYHIPSNTKPPKVNLSQINLVINLNKKTKAALKQGQAIAKGINQTKNLGNSPANLCTPSDLASHAKKLSKQFSKLSCKVLNEADMKKLGMGAILAVSQGSREGAKLIILNYQGAPKNKAPIALVGKGITFDSGGLSLKPPGGMDEMKFDMCGAASVLGVMQAVADLKLPINLITIVATSENLPGGQAIKPGDVVKSLSGKTIEILNTDAEGRLVLSDALTYSRRFKPRLVIDVATLTGAMVVALGAHAAGVMGNDDKLRDSLVSAGEQAGDRAWPMPMWDAYGKELKSSFADMANIGGRYGGALAAGCFLGKFTEGLRWAHMDIAGVAWKSGAQKGATGRPVNLLMHYLLDDCGVL